jgi:SAM-dependent methyltransferase
MPRRPARNRNWPPPRELEGTEDIIDAGSREHYADAVLYDHLYRRRRDDVNFYRKMARQLAGDQPGLRILDVACGSGRLALPLARDGHTVTGIDFQPSMLARAEARAAQLPAASRARLRFAAGDMRRFDLGAQRFDLVISAFNAVEHLYTRVELEAFLASVRRHLAPGGFLAFDVQMPDMGWLIRDPNRRWSRSRVTHPATRQRFEYSTNHDYDPVSQIAVIRLYYEPADGGQTIVHKLTQRKYFPAELEALLAANRYQIDLRFGDFKGSLLDGSGESQIVFARPEEEPPIPDGPKGKKPTISDGVRPVKRTVPVGRKGSKTPPSDGPKTPRRKRSDGRKRRARRW